MVLFRVLDVIVGLVNYGTITVPGYIHRGPPDSFRFTVFVEIFRVPISVMDHITLFIRYGRMLLHRTVRIPGRGDVGLSSFWSVFGSLPAFDHGRAL